MNQDESSAKVTVLYAVGCEFDSHPLCISREEKRHAFHSIPPARHAGRARHRPRESATTFAAAISPHCALGTHTKVVVATVAILSAIGAGIAALGRSIIPPPPERADVPNCALSHIVTMMLPEFYKFAKFGKSGTAPASAPESLPNPADKTDQKAQIIMESPS